MHTALAHISDIRMTNYCIASLVRTLSRAAHQNVLSGDFSSEGITLCYNYVAIVVLEVTLT